MLLGGICRKLQKAVKAGTQIGIVVGGNIFHRRSRDKSRVWTVRKGDQMEYAGNRNKRDGPCSDLKNKWVNAEVFTAPPMEPVAKVLQIESN